jgi:hypothetical protein
VNPQIQRFIEKFGAFLLTLPLTQPQEISMPDGSRIPLLVWHGPVRAVVADFMFDGFTLRLKFLEQNPNKPGSKYAEMAKNGDKICWVIQPGENGQKDFWMGRVHNGEWVPNS